MCITHLLIIMKFNKLTYIKDHTERTASGHKMWICQCDCGRIHIVAARSVKDGQTKSCGCLRGEPATGMSVRNLKEYRTWIDMKSRCYNPNLKYYHYYGGRGITVCDEWRNSFLKFYSDMGPCPEGLTLDRIDNNGNYEPSNCRWATRAEQIHNRGR